MKRDCKERMRVVGMYKIVNKRMTEKKLKVIGKSSFGNGRP